MTEAAKALAESALALDPVERMQLVDLLLASLDRPDPAVEAVWVAEAESRLQLYDEGRLPGTSWEEIQRRYET